MKADDLLKDEEYQQAKKKILEVIEKHQKGLSARPALPELSANYEQLLEQMGKLRGNPLFYPYLGSGFGRGPLVELADGSVKYDLISGIGVHFFGHLNRPMTSEVLDAAVADIVMQGHLQSNREIVELSELLLRAVNKHGAGFEHTFITSSGAMANENALKIAFNSRPGADRVLAFTANFAGRTMAISQITDKPAFRQNLPEILKVDYVPYYKKGVENTIERSLNRLKKHIWRHPGKHACMIFELVQGEGGFNVGTAEFFKALMNECRQNGILVFVDEIQTFGRTPQMFATDYFGLGEMVDLLTIGKLAKVCTTYFRKEIAPKPGLLSQTFISSTVAIRAGKYVMQQLLSEPYYGDDGIVVKVSDYVRKKLTELSQKHSELIHAPQGLGSMVSFQVYDGSLEKTRKFARTLFDNGVICFTAGNNPMRIRFLLPAGNLENDDVDNAMKIIEDTLQQCS